MQRLDLLDCPYNMRCGAVNHDDDSFNNKHVQYNKTITLSTDMKYTDT